MNGRQKHNVPSNSNAVRACTHLKKANRQSAPQLLTNQILNKSITARRVFRWVLQAAFSHCFLRLSAFFVIFLYTFWDPTPSTIVHLKTPFHFSNVHYYYIKCIYFKYCKIFHRFQDRIVGAYCINGNTCSGHSYVEVHYRTTPPKPPSSIMLYHGTVF